MTNAVELPEPDEPLLLEHALSTAAPATTNATARRVRVAFTGPFSDEPITRPPPWLSSTPLALDTLSALHHDASDLSTTDPDEVHRIREGGEVNKRQLQRIDTRRNLAEHALRLFEEQGFDATTVEEIAAAAGVSPRTFFLHFPTKVAAAFPDHDARVATFVARLCHRSDAVDPVVYLIETLVSALDTASPLRVRRYRLLSTVQALSDEDARTDRDYEQAAADFLVEAWGDSPEARLRSRAVANAALGIIRASLIAWSIDGIDPAQASFDMMHRMFGTPLALPLRASRPMQSVQSLQQHAPTRRADRPASV